MSLVADRIVWTVLGGGGAGRTDKMHIRKGVC